VFIERTGGHSKLLCDGMSRAEKEMSGAYFNDFHLDASKVRDKFFGSSWLQQRVQMLQNKNQRR
jgi:hypothetical protein